MLALISMAFLNWKNIIYLARYHISVSKRAAIRDPINTGIPNMKQPLGPGTLMVIMYSYLYLVIALQIS